MILTRSVTRLCTVLLITALAAGPAFARFSIRHESRTVATADSVSTFKPYSAQPSREALKWADKELGRMSLEQKVGQLVSVGINASFLNRESEAYKEIRRQVEANHVGGIILFGSPVYESVVLVNRMQGYARLPLLISADLERGTGMRLFDTTDFGWVMATGATGDPEYARRMGEITGREARALGIQQVLAPVVDVNNNAANPVINVRSFGEDPVQVGSFAAAYVKGAQSSGVIATAKHFPGHGNTATDSHRGLPILNLSKADLNQIELVPFRKSIEAGVGSVMVAHVALPQIDSVEVKPLPRDLKIRALDTTEEGEIIPEEGVSTPASMSQPIGALLTNDLGYKGLVVTDALSMSGLTIYFTQEDAGVRALLAGADMLLKPADVDACIRGVVAAVRSGRLTEKRVEESARKILAAKFDLGLVKQRITPIDEVDIAVSKPAAFQLAREIAEHAITLVRNDANLLPLKPVAGARVLNLAIINGETNTGPFARAMARAGYKVETIVLDERASEAELKKALDRAKEASFVIASLYGRVRTGSTSSIGLPEPGVRALNSILNTKTPVVGISFGNPYLLQSFPGLSTYLIAYGDMPALQEAAARSILGEIDTTGKLPISLPGLYPRGTGIQLKAQKKQ